MTAAHQCIKGYFPVNVEEKRQALERKLLFWFKQIDNDFFFQASPLWIGTYNYGLLSWVSIIQMPPVHFCIL